MKSLTGVGSEGEQFAGRFKPCIGRVCMNLSAHPRLALPQQAPVGALDEVAMLAGVHVQLASRSENSACCRHVPHSVCERHAKLLRSRWSTCRPTAELSRADARRRANFAGRTSTRLRHSMEGDKATGLASKSTRPSYM